MTINMEENNEPILLLADTINFLRLGPKKTSFKISQSL